MTLASQILSFFHLDPFHKAMRKFAKREAEALRRGCTRDVGQVRAERRNFTHRALQG